MSTYNHGELAQRLADAVLQVPGVSRLVPGSGVELATHFAGGKVVGVRVGSDEVEIHVALNRLPLTAVVSEIHGVAHRVLSQLNDSRQVRVVVADIDIVTLAGSETHANL